MLLWNPSVTLVLARVSMWVFYRSRLCWLYLDCEREPEPVFIPSLHQRRGCQRNKCFHFAVLAVSLMDGYFCGVVSGCSVEPGRLLRSDLERIFLTVHPEQQILGFWTSLQWLLLMSLSVYLSVCVYFEDVSQNPFKHSKRPRPLKIGLISKSLLNKRKRNFKKNALRMYFWCIFSKRNKIWKCAQRSTFEAAPQELALKCNE